MTDSAFSQRTYGQPGTLPRAGGAWRLIFVRRGSGAAAIGEKEMLLRRGDALIPPPSRSVRFTQAAGLTLCDALIPPDCLPAARRQNAALREDMEPKEPQILHLERDAWAQAEYLLDTALAEERRRDAESPLLLDGLCACLLAIILREKAREKAADAPPEALEKALRYLDAHVTEDVSLSQLSAVAGLSTRQLDRQFAAAFGMTPVRYLARLRMARARTLLRGTARPITEIAFDCGYVDSNYFARVFRKVCGLSPQQYRQAGGNADEG